MKSNTNYGKVWIAINIRYQQYFQDNHSKTSLVVSALVNYDFLMLAKVKIARDSRITQF